MDQHLRAAAYKAPAGEASLRGTAARLQGLARRLVEAEELERHRIAAELHDRVGQALSALNINLDVALGMVPGEQVEVRMRLADSLALVENMLLTIENLMAELRPPLLDEYGLGAALGAYAQKYARRTGTRVVVDDALEGGRALRPEAAIALFRVAQEALANVAKHAAARNVRIGLRREDGGVVLEVDDDGRGFDTAAQAAGVRWGMTTMRERAAAVGGRLEVHSTLGGGTGVRVVIAEASA